jgi:hypothetical protein
MRKILFSFYQCRDTERGKKREERERKLNERVRGTD